MAVCIWPNWVINPMFHEQCSDGCKTKNRPRNIQERMTALRLEVVSYTNQITEDHLLHEFWIPQDCVSNTGDMGVFWRCAAQGNYSFDGWEPWSKRGKFGTSFGGRYDNFESALAWCETFGDPKPCA